MEHVFPHEVFRIFGIPVRNTVVETWALMAILIAAASAFKAYSRLRPRGWQMIFEAIVEFSTSIIRSMVGPQVERYLPLVGTLILFIASANLLGILPSFGAPTRDINTPLALAIVVFFAVHYYGIRQHGVWGYIKQFARPNIVVLPMNLIGQISRTISLSVRLFGNIIAGEMIVAVIFMLVPPVAPLIMQVFGIIVGLLQAYVFTALSCTYIGAAVETQPTPETTKEKVANAE